MQHASVGATPWPKISPTPLQPTNSTYKNILDPMNVMHDIHIHADARHSFASGNTACPPFAVTLLLSIGRERIDMMDSRHGIRHKLPKTPAWSSSNGVPAGPLTVERERLLLRRL